jgi:hypothetical protein
MITFLIILLLSGVTTYLAYRIWFLAGSVADAQEYIELLETTNEYMYTRITQSYNAMKQIDRLGAFESEDEAGTIFEMLKEVVTELKSEFDNGTSEEK